MRDIEKERGGRGEGEREGEEAGGCGQVTHTHTHTPLLVYTDFSMHLSILQHPQHTSPPRSYIKQPPKHMPHHNISHSDPSHPKQDITIILPYITYFHEFGNAHPAKPRTPLPTHLPTYIHMEESERSKTKKTKSKSECQPLEWSMHENENKEKWKQKREKKTINTPSSKTFNHPPIIHMHSQCFVSSNQPLTPSPHLRVESPQQRPSPVPGLLSTLR